jgi:hypothetical protein
MVDEILVMRNRIERDPDDVSCTYINQMKGQEDSIPSEFDLLEMI